jgi:hypothetical protein
MDKKQMVRKDRDTINMSDCGDRSWTGEKHSDDQRGFVHVLWLLVVLSGLLFGATVVNIGIGLKIYKNFSRFSTALETLNLSTREVQKSILHLSKVLEEAVQPQEEDGADRPSDEGSI